jgi:NADH-quinone oxidoreductase subunit J
MPIAFAILAALTVVSAIAAMTLRNLVHCALCLAVTFAGLAALYLQLGAPFAGWAQVLVYIGAVAILIVFAILLTRSGGPSERSDASRSWFVGAGVAILVFVVLAVVIGTSSVTRREPSAKPEPTVRQIGAQLMTRYLLPLEAMGLLLTAATIGAVILAMPEPRGKAAPTRPSGPTLPTGEPEARGNVETVNRSATEA